jgi:hypothetical protein
MDFVPGVPALNLPRLFLQQPGNLVTKVSAVKAHKGQHRALPPSGRGRVQRSLGRLVRFPGDLSERLEVQGVHCPAAMDELRYLTRRLEMKKDGGGHKERKKKPRQKFLIKA